MFTLEQLGTEWALELTHRCWVDIPGPCPGPLAWSSVTRGDYRKESIPALMTPCHGFSNWGVCPHRMCVWERCPQEAPFLRRPAWGWEQEPGPVWLGSQASFQHQNHLLEPSPPRSRTSYLV